VEAFIIVKPTAPSKELSALLDEPPELLLLLLLLDVLLAVALGVENSAVVVAASAVADVLAWLVNQFWSCVKNDAELLMTHALDWTLGLTP
jgi:hypothetical protein